jgi:WD40 repeat protein
LIGFAAPILDVDWKNNSIFATSSSDKTIYVARVGEESPIKAFVGHTDEVNCINWDGEGGASLPNFQKLHETPLPGLKSRRAGA